ncbi:MAG TPA: 23S rRNA (adenine(2503)-C(2))-methyltransferase RlmN [Moheibacter sp.]|nr:23S rRNA (adenine(2503)-C(2))-methyltransferase RlmN [Moheibacter sp.]
MTDTKKDIRKLNLPELEAYLQSVGEKSFRAKQIYEWLWKKNAHEFEDMTNLSKKLREELDSVFSIDNVRVDLMQKSDDGTIKNAVKLHDGNIVESVLIPTETRTTACVSSQVGCSLNCTFCATATLKRMRNLTAAEIVDQVVVIDKESREYFQRPLSNIVFMGMGEPMMNYNEVVKSIRIITSKDGLEMSPKRITVSTSGIPKMIEKLADEDLKVKLAVSLHSAREEIRNVIMPFTEKFPLPVLLESLQYWYAKTKNKITFEYIVWKGINDTQADIDALVRFCKKVPSKVNLIEYNSIDDGQFQQAENSAIDQYITTLEKNGIVAKVRRSRGKDIDAACGQLANKSIEN